MRMSRPLPLSSAEAKRLILSAQGLAGASPFGKGKEGALKAIEHLGYVQLDTLAVVARAHHHTLWARNASYKETHLDQLLREKKIFEYWSHAASYLPLRDYRFSLPRKMDYQSGRAHWFKKDKRMMQYVLDRIRAEGALQARDFENDRPRGSWFDWKPAKRALEQLFLDGSLMVAARNGFQKVYDLAERVLPPGTDVSVPTAAELARYLAQTALRAQGLVSAPEAAYMRSNMQGPVKKALRELAEENVAAEVRIEGVEETYFASKEMLHAKTRIKKEVRLLSPFDNSVIQRKRLVRMFGYDFQIECYLPEHKRRFGYFCLPILYGDQFVGRLDPKADRAKKIFYVKSLHLEHPVKDVAHFESQLEKALEEFARFNGCEKVVLDKKARGMLRKKL